MVDGDRRGRGAGGGQARRVGRGVAVVALRLALDRAPCAARRRRDFGAGDEHETRAASLAHGRDRTRSVAGCAGLCYTYGSTPCATSTPTSSTASPSRCATSAASTRRSSRTRRRRARLPRVPRRLRHRHVPPRHEDHLLAAQQATRGSRASARSRRGSTWRPSCARAACRWSRSRPSARSREFDVIGISLQYELTFTNVLTLLDLGGIPLRAVDRAEDAPLVLVGGPTASHPEPMAPFIDAAFIGEAEELLPALVLAWAAMRRADPRRRAHAARRARRARVALPALRAGALRDRGRRRDRHDRRRRAARSARAGAGRARDGRATSTRIRSRPTRRCRTPRPCSSARPSRSRAAAPRAAGSARPA